MGNTLIHWLNTAEIERMKARPVKLKVAGAEERAAALRAAAVWCREGAPGGTVASLFGVASASNRPGVGCAVGYALRQLHAEPRDWMHTQTTSAANGFSGLASFLIGEERHDERWTLANRALTDAASAFDCEALDNAAWHLEDAAALVDLMADKAVPPPPPRVPLTATELLAEMNAAEQQITTVQLIAYMRSYYKSWPTVALGAFQDLYQADERIADEIEAAERELVPA